MRLTMDQYGRYPGVVTPKKNAAPGFRRHAESLIHSELIQLSTIQRFLAAERLLASSPARIVNSASASHQGARLDFEDLQSAKGFGAMKAYGRSKLCNILFTRELVAVYAARA